MSNYANRCQQVHNQRFVGLLKTWLSTLPPDGWRGTVADLNAALEVVPLGREPRSYVPSGSGLSKTLIVHNETIRAAGWLLVWNRTAKARTIEFTRLADAD